MFQSTKGKRVKYTRGKIVHKGKVVDDFWVYEREGKREFVDLIQHIKWDDDGTFGIRISYYVKGSGSEEKWRFANRPLSISYEALEELLNKARKKDWFPKS